MRALVKSTKPFYFLALLALLVTPSLMAQNNTNSPYTRFGYGLLNDQSFSRSQGMGGVAYGFRSKQSINPANPASYCAVDSTSFLFDMGISALISNFKSGDVGKTTFNGNLDYLAFQFPITNWMGMSLGVTPFSVVGYDYSFSDSISAPSLNDTVVSKYTQQFFGTGGISQVYLGVSFDIGKHVALGANVYYLFGNINHSRYLDYTSNGVSTYQTSTLKVRSFNARFGIQYYETIGSKHAFNIGAIYEFKSKLDGNIETTTIGVDTTTINSGNLFELPNTYGLGFTYTYDERLTIGLDGTFMQFADAMYYGVRDSLSNRIKICAGAEYVHNPKGRYYAERMYWRFGVNYNNSYAKVGRFDAQDFSITCGAGFPLRTTKTTLNVNFEYGSVGNQLHSPLRENYFKIGLNLSLP